MITCNCAVIPFLSVLHLSLLRNHFDYPILNKNIDHQFHVKATQTVDLFPLKQNVLLLFKGTRKVNYRRTMRFISLIS